MVYGLVFGESGRGRAKAAIAAPNGLMVCPTLRGTFEPSKRFPLTHAECNVDGDFWRPHPSGLLTQLGNELFLVLTMAQSA